jgi:hypothetical protein
LNASPAHAKCLHNYYAKQQQDHKKKPFSLFITNHVPLKENNSFFQAAQAVAGAPFVQVVLPALRNEKDTQPFILCRADDAYKRFRIMRSLLI